MSSQFQGDLKEDRKFERNYNFECHLPNFSLISIIPMMRWMSITGMTIKVWSGRAGGGNKESLDARPELAN